jgi:adenylate cyclase
MVISVLQRTTSSEDFFEHAAQGIVEQIGLSCGAVLLRSGDRWDIAALHRGSSHFESPDPHTEASELWQASSRVLRDLVAQKRTFWESNLPRESENSLAGVRAVIAAPILSESGEVLGALYGDRRFDSQPDTRPITKCEAMLVEALAYCVSAGLARIEYQKAALAVRIRFEQEFGQQLARQLEIEPDLFSGKEAEVTLLFCDIGGFSRIIGGLPASQAAQWVHDVLQVLSDCVIEEDGVLVDYVGDELFAMWGAPRAQPDHALLACKAAAEMVHRVRKVSDKWDPILTEPVRISVGINTGLVHVGNTGSSHKFKYGPLGTTVNVASRVQEANKYLKTSLLITSNTFERLGNSLPVRRLGTVRLVNIKDPITLFQVLTKGDGMSTEYARQYEEALANFEGRRFREAASLLTAILATCPDDGPSPLLLSRTVQELLQPSKDFSPHWILPGK